MSVRDELVGALVEHSCCFTPELAKEWVDRFAHELAEQIRAYADRDDLDYYSPQGLGEAADLIDPRTEEEK